MLNVQCTIGASLKENDVSPDVVIRIESTESPAIMIAIDGLDDPGVVELFVDPEELIEAASKARTD